MLFRHSFQSQGNLQLILISIVHKITHILRILQIYHVYINSVTYILSLIVVTDPLNKKNEIQIANVIRTLIST
jgi:hypothetical protein